MHDVKKTLVILTPGFAFSEDDSTCLPMHQNFVRTLKQEFPELNVIVLAFHYPFHKKQYSFSGAEVRSFGGANKRGLAALLMRSKVKQELRNIHASNELTGILSFWYGECAIVGKKFAEENRIPHYCWILGQDARKTNLYVDRLRPDRKELIALSDFLQEEFFRNHGIKPEHVIPPGMNAFNEPMARDIDILAVGSLIPLKQFEIIIELVGELKMDFPSIRSVIIGEGPEKNKLKQLIREKNLEENISVKGSLSYSETIATMQRSKILLHPSSYEGFSGVCMEALAAGMHVISFTRAMNTDFPQWHIVDNKESMKSKLVELISKENTVYENIQLYKMEDSVRKMMKLYD